MDVLERGLDAFRRREWQEAYDTLRSCHALTAAGLDVLAESAHWIGRPGESIDAYQLAYEAHLTATRSERRCRRS